MAKKVETEDTTKPTMSGDDYIKWRRRLGITKTTMDEAKQAHSVEMKAFKKAGGDEKAIKYVMDMCNKEPAIVALYERNKLLYARFEGLAHLSQTSFDFSTDAADPSEESRLELAKDRAKDDGAFSAKDGVARDRNPHPAGSELHAAWDKAWRENQVKLADDLKANHDNAAPKKVATAKPKARSKDKPSAEENPSAP